MAHPNPVLVVTRGLFRRCPRCGHRPIFETFFNLKPACPQCAFDFEREPGWWVGGMIINIGASMLFFFLILAGGLYMFWPDVPWTALTVTSAAAMAVFPIVFYPISKTVWLAVDLLMTKMDAAVRK